MKEYEFNRYCADVMGYRYMMTFKPDNAYWIPVNVVRHKGRTYFDQYNPYDELNQLVEVFDRLWQAEQPKSLQLTRSVDQFKNNLANHGAIKAFRDFITSTREAE